MGYSQDFWARKVIWEVVHFSIPSCNPEIAKKHFKIGDVERYLPGIFQDLLRIWHRFGEVTLANCLSTLLMSVGSSVLTF